MVIPYISFYYVNSVCDYGQMVKFYHTRKIIYRKGNNFFENRIKDMKYMCVSRIAAVVGASQSF